MHIKDFDPFEFSKKEIDGVTVYYKNLPWAPCLNIRIVFNSGSFDDPIGKEGLAHFLEHLPSNGSPLIPDKKAVRDWSKIYTMNTRNAWTDTHTTSYVCECLPEKYEEVLKGMKDLIFSPFLRPEDVEHERKVVTQEAWGRLLNEKFLAYTKVSMDNIYNGHVHARSYSAAGWPDTIAKITREDIYEWHKKHYGIGNFFIVITGAVEDKNIEQIKVFLKDLPNVGEIKRDYGTTSKPKEKKFIKMADEIGEVKEQVEVTFIRVGEPIVFEMEEIKNVFNVLARDLFHERLRIDHSLCYSVSLGTQATKTFSQFYLNVKTDQKHVEKVQEEYENIFKEIKSGNFRNRFDTVKKVYLDQIRSEELLSSSIADAALKEIVRFDGRIVSLKDQLNKIDKVTYEDIVEFSKWASDPEYVHLEVILPSKK